MDSTFEHLPVLPTEVTHYLRPGPGEVYVDGTIGGGGHAMLIAEKIGATGTIIGLDQDPSALQASRQRLGDFPGTLRLWRRNFRQLGETWRENDLPLADMILLDLGVSSPQLDRPERGFSYRTDGPLDMRLDPDGPTTAAQLVNSLSEAELVRILFTYGEERFARRIARFIINSRQRKPLERTAELAEIVTAAIPARYRREGGHPARRTFQALRLAVNDELGALETVLPELPELLKAGGRVAIISFHSLEDRLVKRFFQKESRDCLCDPREPICRCSHRAILRPLTKKAVFPGDEEATRNPRARSARLRAAERLGGSGEKGEGIA